MKGIKNKIRNNDYLKWILVITNWCFQGILHADRTEKLYKILFSVFGSILTGIFLNSFFKIDIYALISLSFFLGHTLNWIVNCNFSGLIIHRLMISSVTKGQLFDYLYVLEDKLKGKKWVLYCGSFGSICRGKLKDSSDIDISIVRRPGLRNAMASIMFSVKEKKFADFKKIPLEIYISDSPENSIKRFKGENNPVVISDTYNTIDNYYNEKLSISQAVKINFVS
jgi:predicted nucleotidyltransferase